MGMLLNGTIMDDWDERGNTIYDDVLLLVLNASDMQVAFRLPGEPGWQLLLDTAQPHADEAEIEPGQPYRLTGRSLALLRKPGSRAE